ncbi:unnamed protein product [Commensalibacter communis]|uniref:tetratricopeptide repeat protein n=1 Tax=Commensalibacter communis TaxID=2972786 RepID=UPI0022FFB6F4|nr:sel1 repeat family protein [Commensalibacter communis]CAI3933709.1 unnamed protein product [Commensalibacter communis]
MKFKYVLLVTVGLLGGVNDGFAQDSTDITTIEQKAATGDVQAQYNFGMIYYNGDKVPQDYPKAAEWFQKSAGQGNVAAQYHLGLLYEQGKGVSKDQVKAKELIEKAAAQGNVDAQLNLGLSYSKGKNKDYTKAKDWFEKAASQGNITAEYNLGLLYYNGNGVPKDKTKGKALIEKAANQNNVDAQTKMGDICKDEGILLMNSGRYKPADIANPQLRDKAMTELDEIESKIEPLRKKAKDWYEKAANQNGAEAQYKLADCYRHGIGVEKNKQLEEHWLQESAFHGYLEAEKEYASAVRDGDFGSKKAGVAIFFYEKAAKKGDGESQYELGYMYKYGLKRHSDGVDLPQDKVKAKEYFKQACINKYELACSQYKQMNNE